MKKTLLTGIAALFLATGTAHARNSDWGSVIVGEGGYLTCGKFNKLNKVKKDQALAWALGYISGMSTSYIEEIKTDGDKLNKALEERSEAPKLIAEIKRRCLERPTSYFPLIVEWTYVEGSPQ